MTTIDPQNNPQFYHQLQSGRRIVKSLKAKANAKRTFAERMADWMTAEFGSMNFLLINAVWFFVWIIVNVNLIPGVIPFDPFPFGLLTMIVSLEAIMLAIIVLISQNRESRVNELRQEIDLQLDIISETELTKMLSLQAQLMEKNGIDLSQDQALQHMLQKTDTNKIEKALEKQMET